jgi:hypothetical protein
MRRSVRVIMSLAALACGTIACDNYIFGLETVRPCDGPVNVYVRTGPAPTFTWSPACSVEQLTVYQTTPAPATVKWSITSTGGINPGVRYGQRPFGARQVTPPTVLARGQGASVQLVSMDSGRTQVVGGVGFTP